MSDVFHAGCGSELSEYQELIDVPYEVVLAHLWVTSRWPLSVFGPSDGKRRHVMSV